MRAAPYGSRNILISFRLESRFAASTFQIHFTRNLRILFLVTVNFYSLNNRSYEFSASQRLFEFTNKDLLPKLRFTRLFVTVSRKRKKYENSEESGIYRSDRIGLNRLRRPQRRVLFIHLKAAVADSSSLLFRKHKNKNKRKC